WKCVKTGQTALLQRVFSEYYEVSALGQAEPVQVHASATVKNPHDPQAHWCAKSRGPDRKEWIGYKVQVAENIAPAPAREDQPRANFVTSILTQGATESDDAGLLATLEQQREIGLQTPQELYVDGAYISAEGLAKAKVEGGELLGPARASVNNPKGFRTEDFDARIEQRH